MGTLKHTSNLNYLQIALNNISPDKFYSASPYNIPKHKQRRHVDREIILFVMIKS